MILVRLTKNAAGECLAFDVQGHAEFAKEAGELDIVCAAVSALTQTTLLSLDRMVEGGFHHQLDATGRIQCRLKDMQSMTAEAWCKAQALMGALAIGLEEIAAVYDEHITMDYRKQEV